MLIMLYLQYYIRRTLYFSKKDIYNYDEEKKGRLKGKQKLELGGGDDRRDKYINKYSTDYVQLSISPPPSPSHFSLSLSLSLSLRARKCGTNTK